MIEYILIFVLLFVVTVGLYALYSKYVDKKSSNESGVYVKALQDLLDGRIESAFSNLRQAVSEDSDNIDAYLRLGQILREHGKPERALQVHKDLTLRDGLTAGQKATVLKELFLDYSSLKDTDMAEAALKELLSYDSGNRWGHIKLLALQKEESKWEEAYDSAVKILKLESDKSKKPLAVFKYNIGMDLTKKRDYHKARVLFKEALGLDPKYSDAFIAIGDSYAQEERYEDAVNFWEKLIEAVPSDGGRVIDRLKRSLFDLGRFGDIESVCEKILEQVPADRKAKLTLAEIHKKKGELDIAERLLFDLVEESPKDVSIVMQLVRLYLEKNENEKLDRLFRNIEKQTKSAAGQHTQDNDVKAASTQG